MENEIGGSMILYSNMSARCPDVKTYRKWFVKSIVDMVDSICGKSSGWTYSIDLVNVEADDTQILVNVIVKSGICLYVIRAYGSGSIIINRISQGDESFENGMIAEMNKFISKTPLRVHACIIRYSTIMFILSFLIVVSVIFSVSMIVTGDWYGLMLCLMSILALSVGTASVNKILHELKKEFYGKY